MIMYRVDGVRPGSTPGGEEKRGCQLESTVKGPLLKKTNFGRYSPNFAMSDC